MISGRKESGLLAVSRLTAEDPDRRVLVILPYSAERTGKGLALEGSLEEQGEAPVESFPRMMEGVVRRAEKDLGEPRELEIGGDPSRFLACLDDFDPQLLDPELPPVWQPTEEPESEESSAEDAAAPGAPAPVTGEGMVAAQEGAVGLLEDPLP
jgi:hypothetical protein